MPATEFLIFAVILVPLFRFGAVPGAQAMYRTRATAVYDLYIALDTVLIDIPCFLCVRITAIYITDKRLLDPISGEYSSFRTKQGCLVHQSGPFYVISTFQILYLLR